jgi:hypothetical protein
MNNIMNIINIMDNKTCNKIHNIKIHNINIYYTYAWLYI